jgi:hypothetical protein
MDNKNTKPTLCSDLYHEGTDKQPVYGIAHRDGSAHYACCDCAAYYAVARVFAGETGRDVANDINLKVCSHLDGNCDLCTVALVGELQSAAAVASLSGYQQEAERIQDMLTYWAEEKTC